MSSYRSPTAKVLAILHGGQRQAADVYDNLREEFESARFWSMQTASESKQHTLTLYACDCAELLKRAEPPSPVSFEVELPAERLMMRIPASAVFPSPDQSADESGLPRTPHGRIRQLGYLLDEGVIDQEQFRRLMGAPDIADELDGSNAHTDLCECPSCKPPYLYVASACGTRRVEHKCVRCLTPGVAAYSFVDGELVCTTCQHIDRNSRAVCRECRASAPSLKDGRCGACDTRDVFAKVKAESRSEIPPPGSYAEARNRWLNNQPQPPRPQAAEPPLTVERLARAEWRVDPEVSEYIDEASEYEDRIAAGALSAEADAHREQIAAIAWERREPKGTRERAEQRAEAVLEALGRLK